MQRDSTAGSVALRGSAVMPHAAMAMMVMAAVLLSVLAGRGVTAAETPRLRITLDESKLRLRGNAATEEDRAAMIGIARALFPARQISNRIKIGGTETNREAWLGGLSFALKVLSHMAHGAVSIDGQTLEVSGQAIDAGHYTRITSALSNDVPNEMRVEVMKVQGGTSAGVGYTWIAQSTAAGLALSGKVPSIEAQGVLERLAAELFPGLTLINAMEIVNDGVPERFLQASAQALKTLRLLETGSIQVAGQSIEVVGETSNPASSPLLDSLLADFPEGFVVQKRIARRIRIVRPPHYGDVTGVIGTATAAPLPPQE